MSEIVTVVDEILDMCIVRDERGKFTVRYWDIDDEADDPAASRTPSEYTIGFGTWETKAEAWAYAFGYHEGAQDNM